MTLRITTLLTVLLLLTIFPGCNGNNDGEETKAVKAPPPKRSSDNWYIRIVAEDPARGLKTSSAQLGELAEENSTARHTLKALSPNGRRYLDVIFRNPEGLDPGEYKVNFRTTDTRHENRWTFTVRTDDPEANIVLSWKGLYLLTPYRDDANRTRYKEFRSRSDALISHMKLLDLSTGKAYAVADGPRAVRYRFSMNGANERSFEWIVEADPVHAPLPPKVSQKTLRKLRKTDGDFDLDTPPTFKEER